MQQTDDFSAVANGSPRCELAFGRQFRVEPGKEYRIEWSTFLPLDHRFDAKQPESIAQIHQSLSRGSPPFMLTLTGDAYQVEIRGGESDALVTNKHRWGSAAGDLGKWVKWRLHYVADAKGPQAVLQLFKDEVRVLDASGQPNAYAGDTLAYWKLGIYKWGWKKQPSEVSESFTPPADLNNAVNCLVLQPDGRILVGGDFTDAGGVTTLDRLVRLEANGSIDSSFTPPPIAGDFDSVSSIALQPDGRILVGGPLENIGGVATLDRLVRLESGGSLDTSFTPPANLNGRVRTLALQADGRLLVGGDFSNAGGVGALDRLVRLTSTGAIDPAFTPVALNNGVSSAALQVDGRVLVGGLFSDVGGEPTLDQFVCLENAPESGSFLVPQRSTLTWTRDGGAPEACRVTFEVSTDGGATYQALGEAVPISGGWQRTGLTLPLAGTVRARAFVQGGQYNGSSGLVEEILAYTLTRSPVLTLTGKAKLTTSKTRLTLSGTASDPDGDLTAVRFKDSGGKWRTAQGTTSWTAKATLKPGRNTILIAAYDSRNVASAIQRVKVKRE